MPPVILNWKVLVPVLMFLGLVATGAFVWIRAEQKPSVVPQIDAADAEQVAHGRQVYETYCASCHGIDLEGQSRWRERGEDGRLPAPPHDETGHTWHHPDAQLFEITKYGIAPFAPEGYETDMFGFGDTLSDEEIAAVLAYIMSTWPEEIRERQGRISQQYEASRSK